MHQQHQRTPALTTSFNRIRRPAPSSAPFSRAQLVQGLPAPRPASHRSSQGNMEEDSDLARCSR